MTWAVHNPLGQTNPCKKKEIMMIIIMLTIYDNNNDNNNDNYQNNKMIMIATVTIKTMWTIVIIEISK